jgi:hypothetical protein
MVNCPLPLPVKITLTLSGASGSVFIGEKIPNDKGYTDIDLEKKEGRRIRQQRESEISVFGGCGEQVLLQINNSWK